MKGRLPQWLASIYARYREGKEVFVGGVARGEEMEGPTWSPRCHKNSNSTIRKKVRQSCRTIGKSRTNERDACHSGRLCARYMEGEEVFVGAHMASGERGEEVEGPTWSPRC